VIDGASKVIRHSVDLHKDILEVPAPLFAITHSIHSLASEFRGKHRTEPVRPVANQFVADLASALNQQVFDGAQLQRKTDAKHRRQADDLWPRLEVAERGAFCHTNRLLAQPAPRQAKFL
jgi:hypothetical protein